MLTRLNSLLYSEPPPRQAPRGSRYHSRFGGLWTDRLDAVELLHSRIGRDGLTPQLAQKLAFFIEHGYVILEQAVAHTRIDAYLQAFQQAKATRGPLLASIPAAGPQDKGIAPLHRADLDSPLTKVLDTYSHLPDACEIIFAEPIRQFLDAVFGEPLLAFQGLHFERGSTQAIHQDTAYVVLTEPLHFCASWVALEDVQAGSGELIYYSGSHRLPDWLYSGRYKHFNHKRDSHEEHLRHLESLHLRAKERGLELQSFLPKKGDALIWAADLAHGGSAISDAGLTRRSLVTHYTALGVAPYYVRFKPFYRRRTTRIREGCHYNSLYY